MRSVCRLMIAALLIRKGGVENCSSVLQDSEFLLNMLIICVYARVCVRVIRPTHELDIMR
jgi:hypothetical protein